MEITAYKQRLPKLSKASEVSVYQKAERWCQSAHERIYHKGYRSLTGVSEGKINTALYST